MVYKVSWWCHISGAELTGEVKVNGLQMDHKSFSKVSGKGVAPSLLLYLSLPAIMALSLGHDRGVMSSYFDGSIRDPR